jgi:hypothetical protein
MKGIRLYGLMRGNFFIYNPQSINCAGHYAVLYTLLYSTVCILIKIGYIEILCKIKYYKSSEEDNFIDSSISPKAKIRT